jgi:luciferase-type oxidoreductase
MLKSNQAATDSHSPGFRRMFTPGAMTLGMFFPIEAFERDEPTMRDQERLAARAEELGFAALWTRDVPLRDPSFGDIGQVYDPWVWLGWIAAHTSSISLATGSIILPLRHPLHTAKAAASVDQLSGGRLVLGVASGDRPVEFPAFGVDWDQRGVLFRENLAVLRKVLEEDSPSFQSIYGEMMGTSDLVPKPVEHLPILVTGSSRQTMEWIAANADGWITYPRGLEQQSILLAKWRAALEAASPGVFKPFAQSLYIDLSEDPDAAPQPLHLGFRAGRNVALRFLDALRVAGVNHIAFNLKYSARPAGEVLEEIGQKILPEIASSREPLGRATPQ